MKSAGGDKQNMIGFHHPVFGHHVGAFHNRQDIPLNSFSGHIGLPAFLAVSSGDFVNLIQKDDAGIFDSLQSLINHLVHSDELIGLFLSQDFPGLGNAGFPCFLFGRHHIPEHVLEI